MLTRNQLRRLINETMLQKIDEADTEWVPATDPGMVIGKITSDVTGETSGIQNGSISELQDVWKELFGAAHKDKLDTVIEHLETMFPANGHVDDGEDPEYTLDQFTEALNTLK